MIKRIGVWLPFSPLPPATSIRGEGLFRLLSFIAEGFESGAKFVIVTPSWALPVVKEEFEDLPPAVRHRFELISVGSLRSLPSHIVGVIFNLQRSMWKIEEALVRYDRRHGFARLVDIVSGRALARSVVSRLTIQNAARAVKNLLAVVVLVLVGFGLGWGAAGLLVVFGVFAIIAVRVLYPLLNRFKDVSFIRGIFLAETRIRTAALWPLRTLQQYLRNAASQQFERDLRCCAHCAHLKAGIDNWFITHVASDSARFLKGKVTCLFADFVYKECPDNGDLKTIRKLQIRTKRLLRRADDIIALSDYVVESQLARFLSRRSKARVHMIPHAPVDISGHAEYLERSGHKPIKTAASLFNAAEVLRTYCAEELKKQRLYKFFRVPIYDRHKMAAYEYLANFPFESVPLVFCSTQLRPYKNILTLIKAVERLIRRDYIDIKLILTADLNFSALRTPGEPTALTEVLNYVKDKRLQIDVISLSRIPNRVHAAIYHLSSLTVHPSFFEGGRGAFPLWESLSVGTPAIVARNPTSTEDAVEDEYKSLLFDPYSSAALAKRISQSISDGELFNKQWIMFENRSHLRNWAAVGEEYLKVLAAVETDA